MSTASPHPLVFQATWLNLLPRFLGWTVAMMIWFALQASAWLLDKWFQIDWLGITAAVIGLAILPHFLSSLVALLVPARRRLMIDQEGISFTLGITRFAGSWAQCGVFKLHLSLLRNPVLRMSGEMKARPILWRLLEWPFYMVIWLILMLFALLVNPTGLSTADFPETIDCGTIPSFFHRGKDRDRLVSALGQYIEILTPAAV